MTGVPKARGHILERNVILARRKVIKWFWFGLEHFQRPTIRLWQSAFYRNAETVALGLIVPFCFVNQFETQHCFKLRLALGQRTE